MTLASAEGGAGVSDEGGAGVSDEAAFLHDEPMVPGYDCCIERITRARDNRRKR